MGITIRLRFKPSQNGGAEGVLYFKITHRRQCCNYATNYKILASEWDSRNSVVVPPRSGTRRDEVLKIRQRIRWEMSELSRMAKKML
ncbi:MAG: hypothetical protein HUK20_06980, partial [Fibrobacter sp.]|nr:hypothetical protein [Bacteroidales bacterium]MCF0223996.1 hypothetical protein [Fibrobacter sp.]